MCSSLNFSRGRSSLSKVLLLLAICLCVLFSLITSARAYARAESQTITILIVGAQQPPGFSPSVVTAQVGDTLAFQNASNTPATYTIVASDNSFHSPPIAPGGQWGLLGSPLLAMWRSAIGHKFLVHARRIARRQRSDAAISNPQSDVGGNSGGWHRRSWHHACHSSGKTAIAFIESAVGLHCRNCRACWASAACRRRRNTRASACPQAIGPRPGYKTHFPVGQRMARS